MTQDVSLGSSASDLVAHIIMAHTDIISANFLRYPPMPTFTEVKRKEPLTTQEELDRRLRHGGKKTSDFALDRAEVTSENLVRLLADLPPEAALALSSKVNLVGEQTLHIPLVDFQCTKTVENLSYLTLAMRRLDTAGGFILASENSYHFYGRSLLSQSNWLKFSAMCLLLEPLVDIRYIGHCLLDGFSALRISMHRLSQREVPTVVAIL